MNSRISYNEILKFLYILPVTLFLLPLLMIGVNKYAANALLVGGLYVVLIGLFYTGAIITYRIITSETKKHAFNKFLLPFIFSVVTFIIACIVFALINMDARFFDWYDISPFILRVLFFLAPFLGTMSIIRDPAKNFNFRVILFYTNLFIVLSIASAMIFSVNVYVEMADVQLTCAICYIIQLILLILLGSIQKVDQMLTLNQSVSLSAKLIVRRYNLFLLLIVILSIGGLVVAMVIVPPLLNGISYGIGYLITEFIEWILGVKVDHEKIEAPETDPYDIMSLQKRNEEGLLVSLTTVTQVIVVAAGVIIIYKNRKKILELLKRLISFFGTLTLKIDNTGYDTVVPHSEQTGEIDRKKTKTYREFLGELEKIKGASAKFEFAFRVLFQRMTPMHTGLKLSDTPDERSDKHNKLAKYEYSEVDENEFYKITQAFDRVKYNGEDALAAEELIERTSEAVATTYKR